MIENSNEILESQEQEVTVDLVAELEQAQAKVKELQAKLNPAKTPKGDKVQFVDGDGKVIEGYGVLYYCVRHNGKLKYKEASQVAIIEKRLPALEVSTKEGE